MGKQLTGRPVGRPPKVKKSAFTEGNIEENGTNNIPEPPTSLGIDGLKLWNRIWSNSGKTLDPFLDYILMETLCNITDEIAFIRAALSVGKIGGGVDRSYVTNGYKSNDPYVNQLDKLRRQQAQCLSELGLTPAARAKMGQTDTITTGAELVLSFRALTEDIRNNAKAEGENL
jgi:P27 family predicted phage terminase small subunit